MALMRRFNYTILRLFRVRPSISIAMCKRYCTVLSAISMCSPVLSNSKIVKIFFAGVAITIFLSNNFHVRSHYRGNNFLSLQLSRNDPSSTTSCPSRPHSFGSIALSLCRKCSSRRALFGKSKHSPFLYPRNVLLRAKRPALRIHCICRRAALCRYSYA